MLHALPPNNHPDELVLAQVQHAAE